MYEYAVYLHRCLFSPGGALSSFSKSTKQKPANKVFLPPTIPRGYQPFLYVKEQSDIKVDNIEISSKLSSGERGKILGEQPLKKTPKSVLDFLSENDRERISSVKEKTKVNSLAFVSTGFKPFAKDPAKQERYERFLASQTSDESLGSVKMR